MNDEPVGPARRAVELLRANDPADELAPGAVARLGSRLRAADAAPRRLRGRGVVVAIFVAAAAAGASTAGWQWVQRNVEPRPAAVAHAVDNAPGPVADEARALADAERALREGRAQAAVSLLSAYETKYPHGILLPEALATRARASIALGDDAGAVAAFERLGVHGVPPAMLQHWAEALGRLKQCDGLERLIASAAAAQRPDLERVARGVCPASSP